jgi:WD40 repeat protein
MVRVWNVGGSSGPTILRGHESGINAVAISADGKHVVSGGDDATARVWNADGTGKPVVLRANKWSIESVAISAGGRVVTRSDAVRVWNADGTGKPIVLSGSASSTIRQSNSKTHAVALTPDGERVACGWLHGSVLVWDLKSGGSPRVLRAGRSDIVSVAFSPDGLKVAGGSVDERRSCGTRMAVTIRSYLRCPILRL